MRKLLHSTTSITLCMALVVPGMTPTMAAAQTVACGAPGEQTTFPCALADGTEVTNEAELQSLSAGEATAEAVGEAPQPEAAEETEAAPEAQTEKAAEADAPSPSAEQAVEPSEQEAEAAPADAEQQSAAETTAEATTQAEENSADAEVDQQNAADAAAQAEQEAATQAAELEQALKDEQAAAETQAQEQSTEQTEPTAQAETPAPAENQEAAETAAAPEQSATPPETEQAAEKPVDEEARAARQAARQESRRAERQAQRKAAREALDQEPATETTTQEVTADETRRSDQDFETSATGSAEAQNNDDDGLSNLEKALLLGLGAAVVGTVLKNGDRVMSNSGDRVVVQDDAGDLRVLKDDDALLRRPGDEVRTETFNDGSTRQIVEKPNGSRIVTIRGSDGTVLRRISVDANGNETTLFDDLADEREVIVSELPQIRERSFSTDQRSEEDLRAALIAQQRGAEEQNRSFSLRQVREIEQVRALAPPIELDAARFATGSAAIAPEQARSLARVGNTLRDMIAENPRTVFLIEGHTDAVGDATYNLALSDRRAETVALALTEYFDVPPENMITQGYGESALKVQTSGAEQANRRAVVRNITNLLRQASN